jgi:hypothetical protein
MCYCPNSLGTKESQGKEWSGLKDVVTNGALAYRIRNRDKETVRSEFL